MSNTLLTALALALATAAVLVGTSLAVAVIRRALRPELRLIAQLAIIAALVSTVDLFLRALFFELHATLGIFVPLIASNCLLLARAESYMSRHGPVAALSDALHTAFGFTLVFAVLGASRELIARGTLLGDMSLLAPGADGLQLFDGGLLLAAMPPGAFFALALLIAATRALSERRRHAGRIDEPVPEQQ